MKYFLPLFLLFCLLPFSHAQDTLALAREKAFGQNFHAADQLLQAYNARRDDLSALWFHAQVLFWKKDFTRSAEVFERAISAFPEAHFLRLEYGRNLWNQGEIYPAQEQLLSYLGTDSLHFEANMLQAYIEYWTGRLPLAKKRIGLLQAQDPSYSPVQDLLAELESVSAPWLSLKTGYLSDDQPLGASQTELEGGKYISWLLNPTFHVEYSHFGWEGEIHPVFQAQLRNQVFFGKTKTRAELSAGLMAPLSGESPAKMLGGILVSQSLPAHFTLEAGLHQRPYLYTLASIRAPLTETFSQAALRFDYQGKWLGKAAFEQQAFSDQNAIQTAYAWFLATLLDRWGLRVQAGYAYSHATAGESRFQPDQTYAPYFTPANQEVHAILGSLRYSPKKWQFAARVSAGVSAQADIPYFYLDLNPDGEVENFIGFSRDSYSPLEITGEVSRGLGAHSSLSAVYSYQRLLFYTLHYGGLQIKHQFVP